MGRSTLLSVVTMCVLCCGCTSMRKVHEDRPDVRALAIQPGIAFDIRILKDIYGAPQIIDTVDSALVYANRYEFEEWWLFESSKPDYSEDWYLVLRPTDDQKYYTGKKYRLWLDAASSDIKGKDLYFQSPPKFTGIKQIIEQAEERKSAETE